jgi:predicted RNA methylase
MSSTKRTKEEKAVSMDYYMTPLQSIRDFITAAREDGLLTDTSLSVLDPCAGGDANNPMSYPTVLKEFGFDQIHTVDIRPDSPCMDHGDYLDMVFSSAYDIIITNPPFNLAMQIIQKALDDAKHPDEAKSMPQGGVVIMLQRLNFLGSQTRSAWFKKNMPARIYVHSRRMKFHHSLSTDSIEYAHYVWFKGFHPQASYLRVI